MSSKSLLSHEIRMGVREVVREELRKETREGLSAAREGVGMGVMR